MGLMVGEFVDDLTIYVVDVFPMPQLGTAASVETIDEKFQSDYMELLKQTGRWDANARRELIIHRMENVVGWYHSHPGFGCWLSSVDVQTQAVRDFIRDLFLVVRADGCSLCCCGGRSYSVS